MVVGLFPASVSSGWHSFVHGLSNWNRTAGSHVTALEVAGLVVAAVALLAFVAVSLGSRSKHDLREALDPYRIHPRDSSEVKAGNDSRRSFAERLVTVVSGITEHRRFNESLTSRIERSGLPIAVPEFLVICLCGAVVLLAVGGYVGGLIGLIVGLVVAVFVPFGILQFLTERRRRRFESQIPDILKLLAASLRAGFSFMQGFDALLAQTKEPMASELHRAFAATRLGTPVEDALQAVADRSGSRDFGWTVMAIRIQREVGGNLAEILDTVCNTMTERERLRREVRTLTAEGRLSAIVLAVLPVAIGLMIYMINRPYVSVLFHTFSGQLMLTAGVLLELVGVWWLNRLVKIEL